MLKNAKQEILIKELSSIRTMIEKNISVKNGLNDKEVMSQKSQDNEQNIGSEVNKQKKTIEKINEDLNRIQNQQSFIEVMTELIESENALKEIQVILSNDK